MTKVERHGKLCDDIKCLYIRKNHDYGDSFARARKVIPHYTLGRLYDKFSRYMNLTLNEEKQMVKEETINDTLMDLANYAIMELTERLGEIEEQEESNHDLE